MISMSIAFFSCSLLIADRAIHKLLVLNILNFDTDLNSSTCAFGTWAISTSLSLFSYCVSVPPCGGQRRSFKSCSWDLRETFPSPQTDAQFCWHLKLNLSENMLLVFTYQVTSIFKVQSEPFKWSCFSIPRQLILLMKVVENLSWLLLLSKISFSITLLDYRAKPKLNLIVLYLWHLLEKQAVLQ